ncbi:MAG TPA: non-reducing end alpha-L-arabinofuranosidase family hydrolase, partial [Polyangia bacterium]
MPIHRSRGGVLAWFAALGVAGALGACSGKSAVSKADAAQDAPAACGVPTAFAWTSTGPILGPQSDTTHDLAAIKDPSVVYYGDLWRVFTSTIDRTGAYNMAYLTFPDWDHTANATFY